jgi:hypothetical protein
MERLNRERMRADLPPLAPLDMLPMTIWAGLMALPAPGSMVHVSGC